MSAALFDSDMFETPTFVFLSLAISILRFQITFNLKIRVLKIYDFF